VHCLDLARLLLAFFHSPRIGEVYNVGGGRENSISILETIRFLADIGLHLEYEYSLQPRLGDHICYYSDLSKVRSHFPEWRMEHCVRRIVCELGEHRVRAMTA
jgi:CDP-paratose 2-epimerase